MASTPLISHERINANFASLLPAPAFKIFTWRMIIIIVVFSSHKPARDFPMLQSRDADEIVWPIDQSIRDFNNLGAGGLLHNMMNAIPFPGLPEP